MELSPVLPAILAGIVEARPATRFTPAATDELQKLIDNFVGVGTAKKIMDAPPQFNSYVIQRANETPETAFGLVMANYVLIHAHLYRRSLTTPELVEQRDALLRQLKNVVDCGAIYAMTYTWRAQHDKRRHFQGAMDTYLEFGARMAHALGLRDKFEGVPVEFRQLFEEKEWAALSKSPGMAGVKNFRDFLSLPPAKRSELTLAAAAGDAKRGKELNALAGDFPLLDGAAIAYVDGEAMASENDILTLRAIVRHANIDGLGDLPRPAPVVSRTQTDAASGPRLPAAYAPALAGDTQAEWHVFVEDGKTGNFVPNAYVRWNPQVAIDSVSIMFPATNMETGERRFRMYLKSSTYLGLNVVFETPM
jgi:hypothetical protein